MPRAKLTVTVPDRVWIGELSRRYPAATVRVMAAFTDEDAGVGLAEVRSDRIDDFLADLSTYEDVFGDVLRRTDTQALVQFETTMPLLLLPARDSGVPLEMPFDISDGEVEWELTASRDRLSELGDQLDAFDITYRVEYVREHVEEDQLLTDRQRSLVIAAIESGYYDTPRTVSLTELADRLGIAKSTASETLHRAEEHIIKDYAESMDAAERPSQ